MLKKLIFCFMSFFLIQNIAYAQSYEFDIVMPDTPELTGTSGKELAGETGVRLKAILEQIEGTVTYTITGSSRAYDLFYEGKHPCVAPDSSAYYGDNSGYLDSIPLEITDWVAVYNKDEKKIVTQDDLLGLKVGTAYTADSLLPVLPQSGVDYKVNGDYLINLKKLAAKRIDAVVLPMGDLDALLASDPSLSNLTYDASNLLAQVPDAVMCHDNERGRAVIEMYNKAAEKVGN